MAVHRAFHTVWYLLYLATYLVFLYFFLYYAKVPSWVFWLFFAGIIIIGAGVVQKETLLTRQMRSENEEIKKNTRYGWTIVYGVLHLVALGLIITGLVFVIMDSTIPWWVWLLAFLGLFFTIVGAMIHTVQPHPVIPVIAHIIGLGLSLAAFVYIVMYSGSPYWVWLIYAASIFFGILAGSFEHSSKKNVKYVTDEQCVEEIPCETHEETKVVYQHDKEECFESSEEHHDLPVSNLIVNKTFISSPKSTEDKDSTIVISNKPGKEINPTVSVSNSKLQITSPQI